MPTEQIRTEDVHSDHRLKREFTLWSAFAFAFAFISPIVALYGIFGLAYSTAGPSFWWNFLIVFGGQLLVAMVFAELVSRWPIEGSIYQWSRKLLGQGYGWSAGWVYMWTLVVAMSAVSMFAAGFVGNVFGWDLSAGEQAMVAWVILMLGTAANIAGRLVLRVLMTSSIIAEIIGSIGLGMWLILFHRENSFSSLTDGFGDPGYLSLSGPFLVSMAFVGWSFVGFESAGSIAEEVHHPRRNLPKAVIFSIGFIALIVMFSALAIILAIPEDVAVNSADPVYDTLAFQLGSGPAKLAEILFTVGFLASFLALQTSASRLIWSYARDRALPAPRLLAKLTKVQKQPVSALLVATTIGTVVIVLSQLAPDFYTLMLNFTSGGFYLAFLFPLAGNLLVRLRGDWQPGPFSLGRWSMVVSVAAVLWATFQFLNIAWPRNFYPDTPFLNWSVALAVVGLALVGAAIYAARRGEITTFPTFEVDDPEDDAETRDYLAAESAVAVDETRTLDGV
ncbi:MULTISPECIES: APC family permease [unclassified Nocardioides]|uniref:APC family permease n=1 Tax=unclassified Nocardioides TaxID=2615069 RepID=UPI00005712EB|nr:MULTISPECIES: APC family permease [unclassified Nocardioides]ABL82880.1 amino acid/polyamine/organocation transporter, APC superfamily [Nocardioides sp. JS614]